MKMEQSNKKMSRLAVKFRLNLGGFTEVSDQGILTLLLLERLDWGRRIW